jgi:hypothetical protein
MIAPPSPAGIMLVTDILFVRKRYMVMVPTRMANSERKTTPAIVRRYRLNR